MVSDVLPTLGSSGATWVVELCTYRSR